MKKVLVFLVCALIMMSSVSAWSLSTLGDIFARGNITGTPKVIIGSQTVNDVAIGRFIMNVTASATGGPNSVVYTTADRYPMKQELFVGHDNWAYTIDGYWDGAAWRSSNGSNFQFRKLNDDFQLNYDSGVPSGNGVVWNTGFNMDLDTGRIAIGAGLTNSNQRLTVAGNANITGNMTGNLLSAEVYKYHSSGSPFTISTTGLYYNISNMTSNHLNGFTFDGMNLSVLRAGRYKFDFGMSFSGGNNQEYGLGLAKNGVIDNSRNCYLQRSTSTTLVGNVFDSCTLAMVPGDYVVMQIDDEAGVTANVVFKTLSITAVRIGN